jgi:alpha-ketoglutarate-dependent taurine dioxygenase
MLRELEIDGMDLDAIGEALLSLRDSEDVLVVKRGGLKIPKEEWIRLLENRFGLIADRRHFTPKWAADDAKRMERELAEGRASGGSTAAQVAEKERQMAPADWWEISYQPDKAQAYAYSKTRQPLHTDNAWFADPAEINFFIMRKQAVAGGEQTIYPLSRLIEDLSREDPGLFRDLTSVPVTIRKGDNDYYNRTPIIALANTPRVYWNYYRTEKPTPEINAMCEAFFGYLEGKEATPSVEKIRCATGDCLSFNDLKMLHGRTAFVANEPRDRVLLHSMWKLAA